MGDEHICVLYVDRPAASDGIRDFSEGLVRALGAIDGIKASMALWREDGWRSTAREATAVVVQYNPFSYGRWGLAPRLITDLYRLRKPQVSVMIHEPFVPISDWRSAVMGGWQRFQLRRLLGLADGVGLSTESFRPCLPRRDRTRAVHLPVSSPLPDARGRRAELRDMIGAREQQLVIALYGSAHPSRLTDYCCKALHRLVAVAEDPIVLNLGADAPDLPVPDGTRMLRPGILSAPELAAWLAATDLALLPFVDGASTRRTTLIAALQQAVCVLSTHGPLTDRELANGHAPILTEVGDPAAFARAASVLAADSARRAACAGAGRRLYDELFSWPTVAHRVLTSLRQASAR